MWMTELYSPRNESELLVLRSVFDASGIHYFVKNDLFGSLAVGPQIDHYNRKTVYVAADDLDEARLLVREFLELTAEPDLPREPPGLLDVLRMMAELLLFGWFMPGRRARLHSPDLRAVDGDGEPTSSTSPTSDDSAKHARARFRLIQGSSSRGGTARPDRDPEA